MGNLQSKDLRLQRHPGSILLLPLGAVGSDVGGANTGEHTTLKPRLANNPYNTTCR